MLPALSPGRCVLAVIDVQNDFCHPDGGYARLGQPVDHAAAALPGIEKVLGLSRQAGVPRVFVRVAHSEWTDDEAWLARGSGGAVLDLDRVPIAREGTWGAEFYGIAPQDGELVLTKHRYSAFEYTPLELVLRAKHASTLVLAGVATNVCVHATARGALFAGFLPAVVSDATGAYSEALHSAALADISSYLGRVVTIADLEAAWS
jgi:nicotinamidase-related amidase